MKKTNTNTQWTTKYRPKSHKKMALPDPVRHHVEMIISARLLGSILITGGTGFGKTSLARIIAYRLFELPYGAETSDLCEINMSQHRGIDYIKSLIGASRYLPSKVGGVRVYILDEVHGMTEAAFSAFLQVLEEPPEHCVFVLVTNKPELLPATVRNRCCSIHIGDVPVDALKGRMLEILATERALERWAPADRQRLVDACISMADGVPRAALQMLQDAVASDGKFASVNALVQSVQGFTSTIEARQQASVILLATLMSGEGKGSLKSMLAPLAQSQSGELLEQLLVVTAGLILKVATGTSQHSTRFFEEIVEGRLEDVRLDHLQVVLDCLVKTKASLSGDSRAVLIDALLRARSALQHARPATKRKVTSPKPFTGGAHHASA